MQQCLAKARPSRVVGFGGNLKLEGDGTDTGAPGELFMRRYASVLEDQSFIGYYWGARRDLWTYSSWSVVQEFLKSK